MYMYFRTAQALLQSYSFLQIDYFSKENSGSWLSVVYRIDAIFQWNTNTNCGTSSCVTYRITFATVVPGTMVKRQDGNWGEVLSMPQQFCSSCFKNIHGE
jgi:hypothetical protein